MWFTRIAWNMLFIIAALGLWQGITIGFHIPEYTLPSPMRVGHAVWETKDILLGACRVTLLEAVVGLIFAFILSAVAASIFALKPAVENMISPVLVGIQSTPILALAPLLTLWFGTGMISKGIAACVVCFFPLVSGWSAGLRSVDVDEIDYFRTLHATRLQVLRFLIIPRSLPFFFAGLKVAAPLSILGAIVGEFVGASEGLGFQLISSSYYVRTAEMLGDVIILSVFGITAHGLVSLIEAKWLFWHGNSRTQNM